MHRLEGLRSSAAIDTSQMQTGMLDIVGLCQFGRIMGTSLEFDNHYEADLHLDSVVTQPIAGFQNSEFSRVWIGDRVLSVQIGAWTKSLIGDSKMAGLVLAPAGEEGTFTRIGMFYVEMSSINDPSASMGWKRQKIVLV